MRLDRTEGVNKGHHSSPQAPSHHTKYVWAASSTMDPELGCNL